VWVFTAVSDGRPQFLTDGLCKIRGVDAPLAHDDVLSQPTRATIFTALTEARRPMGTDELAQRLELHPNGVRLHLDRLLDAGLVTRERVRQSRGRPRDMWAVAPDARPGGSHPTGYADLGRWLARAAPATRAGLRAIEATGRQIGRDIAPQGSNGPAEKRMHTTLSALGFAPRRKLEKSGALTYKLCNCPYRDAVVENRDAVCTLHRGITRGLLDQLSPSTELSEFIPKDPRRAGCLIELRGPLADEIASRPANPR